MTKRNTTTKLNYVKPVLTKAPVSLQAIAAAVSNTLSPQQ